MPPFTVTILGSGTSHGIPVIGCDCAVCRSPDPRDQRTRSSIFIHYRDHALLVDTTPELRLQLVRERIHTCTAVLFTHQHADHVMGFDDLRRFSEMTRLRLPIYGSTPTLDSLQRIFPYTFEPTSPSPTYLRVDRHDVSEPFAFGDLIITPLPVPHGSVTTYGYLFAVGERRLCAYLSDCAAVPEPIRQQIEQVELLIIDGLRDQPHPTHLTSQQAVEIGLAVGAKATYLTHLTHHKTHKDREQGLPSSCFIAYDGLKVTL